MEKLRTRFFLLLAIASAGTVIAVFLLDAWYGNYDKLLWGPSETFSIEHQEIDFKKHRDLRHYHISHFYSEFGEEIDFKYRLENHRFFRYTTPIKITMHKGRQKISTLLSERKTIDPFGEVEVEWIIKTANLKRPSGREKYIIRIETKEMKRAVIFVLHSPVRVSTLPSPIPIR